MDEQNLIDVRVFPGLKWVFGAPKKTKNETVCIRGYRVTLFADIYVFFLPFHK